MVFGEPRVAPPGAVFLDRDGTVNHSELRDGRPYAPTRLVDFRILEDAPEAVARIRAAGYRVFIATNQPDLATGKQTWETVTAMHNILRSELGVDDFLICPHTDEAGCACRKPKPGLILKAARKWSVDPGRSVMVGDRWRDVEAGREAGCATVFIDRGYTEDVAAPAADLTVDSLGEAVTFILARLGADAPCRSSER